jgi:hypothetical protein
MRSTAPIRSSLGALRIHRIDGDCCGRSDALRHPCPPSLGLSARRISGQSRRSTDAPAANVIEVDRLSKRFGDFSAVEDTSLTVREGEVFAFLEAFPYSGGPIRLSLPPPDHRARSSRRLTWAQLSLSREGSSPPITRPPPTTTTTAYRSRRCSTPNALFGPIPVGVEATGSDVEYRNRWSSRSTATGAA